MTLSVVPHLLHAEKLLEASIGVQLAFTEAQPNELRTRGESREKEERHV